MKAQHEAAARVIARAYGRDFDTDEIAARAVKAADRITFSEAAIVAAARTLCPASTEHDGDWVCPQHYADVKATITALRKAKP